MTQEYERTWKEMATTQCKFYPSSCMEGLKKTMKILLKIEGYWLKIELGIFRI
jgi:hypothetical protein